MVQALLNL